LSLYSGIGMMDLAAQTAGIEIAALCEPDAYCRHVLFYYHPGKTIYEYDHLISADRLRTDGIGPIDLIFGGPPCQPASAAGKRLGESDPRWRWPEFLRIVGDCRPRWIVAENPPGILSLAAGWAFQGILAELERLGYRTGRMLFGADAVGAPHRRDRLFIVGYLADAPSDICNTGAERARRQTRANTGGSGSPAAMADSGRLGSKRRGGTSDLGSTAEEEEGKGPEWERFRHAIDDSSPAMADPFGKRRHADAGCCRIESLLGCSPAGLAAWVSRTPWPMGPGQEQEDWEPARTAPGRSVSNRVDRLKALGNGVVPAQAYVVFRAITG
jgi:DNA (cytosine-5)-methyltransferase 1